MGMVGENEQYLQEVIVLTRILKFANVVTRLENIMDKLTKPHFFFVRLFFVFLQTLIFDCKW
jgi:hypothetical protein